MQDKEKSCLYRESGDKNGATSSAPSFLICVFLLILFFVSLIWIFLLFGFHSFVTFVALLALEFVFYLREEFRLYTFFFFVH